MNRESHQCPNCGHQASVRWGHEAGEGSGKWLCAEFARERFDCGCSLDFGLCGKHQPMVAGVLSAIWNHRLSVPLVNLIRAIARMPEDEYEYASFVRSAGPARIERMAKVAGL
jgi:hypothetical protein